MSILGGDFRYFWPENIGNFISFPLAWDASLNTGIGRSSLSSLWINSYLNFTAAFSNLGLSWDLIGLIFWILPALLLSFSSSFYLFRYLFRDNINGSFLSGIIYTTNTYFLMIFAGGQAGVSLSYSLAPLVLMMFIKTLESPTFKNSTLAGLVLGLQMLFDPRIVYLTLFAFLLYLTFNFSVFIKVIKKSFMIFIAPFMIGILLHVFWILPMIIFKSSPIPQGFDNLSGFRFFSFADFSHAISLLHPNWPENIFGKVYFLQPEFLILPILAYSSLLFITPLTPRGWDSFAPRENYNLTILFFTLLGVIGTFLAKGANPPFGEVNMWLFQYFPGMLMFRDPTKFYLLIAISYSVLIPFSTCSIYNWFKSKLKTQNSKPQLKIQNYLPNLFLIFTILYLIFLLRPLWMGELRDKFKPKKVPQEYVDLKNFLVSKPQFFRTLWIPMWQRFGYFSNLHPAIGREEVLKGNAQKQIKELQEASSLSLLKDLSVGYVIIPFDSEGEIFLKDRKYDEREYKRAIDSIRAIDGLKEVKSFGKIRVFEINDPKDHFWSPSTTLGINYTFVNPTKYIVEVQNVKEGDLLVFSESFDTNWQAQVNESNTNSKPYNKLLNSFILSNEGTYTFEIYYASQKWVNIGLVISGTTIILSLGLLGFGKIYKKW